MRLSETFPPRLLKEKVTKARLQDKPDSGSQQRKPQRIYKQGMKCKCNVTPCGREEKEVKKCVYMKQEFQIVL